jgi:protoheme IX farnesyltransferase
VLKDYYQLTKPGIIYGNAMTAIAGYLLASKTDIELLYLIETVLGICLIIASACVINNLLDRKIDILMARTKKRALVTGIITPRNAVVYSLTLGVIGFGILFVFSNLLTVSIGAVGYIDYILFYGYYKRHSVHGTLIGSISGAVPILAGYCSVTDHITSGAVLIFLILIFWQMPHFYAISLARFSDYSNAHIPVLPVKSGAKHTKVQILIYIILFSIAALLPTVYGYTGYVYLITMSVLCTYWLYLSISGFAKKNDQIWAKGLFRYSLIVILVFSVIVSFGTRIG